MSMDVNAFRSDTIKTHEIRKKEKNFLPFQLKRIHFAGLIDNLFDLESVFFP